MGNIYLWLPILVPYVMSGMFAYYIPELSIEIGPEIGNTIIVVYASVWFTFAVVAYYGLATRRCHDFNQPLWLISAATFSFILGLPGTSGPNDYGPQPHGYGPLRILFGKESDGLVKSKKSNRAAKIEKQKNY